MSIAQQIATPTPTSPVRRPRAGLVPAPVPRRGSALLRIAGLVTATAFLATLTVGIVAVGLLVVLSNLGA